MCGFLPKVSRRCKEMPDTWQQQIKTGGENDSPARELARFIKSQGERYVPGMTVDIIYRKDRYLRGGDHSPFLEAGYAAVRMTEPNEDYRHQHQDMRKENGVQFGDLPEFVDFEYVAQVARINAASLGALALGPAAPSASRDGNEGADQRHDFALAGEQGTRSRRLRSGLAGNDRAALAAFSFPPGKRRVSPCPKVSKDNYLFGVTAIDADGNRSPAVYPAPSAK